MILIFVMFGLDPDIFLCKRKKIAAPSAAMTCF